MGTPTRFPLWRAPECLAHFVENVHARNTTVVVAEGGCTQTSARTVYVNHVVCLNDTRRSGGTNAHLLPSSMPQPIVVHDISVLCPLFVLAVGYSVDGMPSDGEQPELGVWWNDVFKGICACFADPSADSRSLGTLSETRAGMPLVEALQSFSSRTDLGPLLWFVDGPIVAVELSP